MFAAGAGAADDTSAAAGSINEMPAAGAPVDASVYLGRWDLTLKSPEREYSSWLEITRHDGGIQARMVGRWGHARLLPTAELVNGGIRFVSPKKRKGRTDGDMIFEGRLQEMSWSETRADLTELPGAGAESARRHSSASRPPTWGRR
jgi:hypothetical protein